MQTRRRFVKNVSALTAGAAILPSYSLTKKIDNAGVQLYTFRDEMMKDATGTLKKIASLGIKQIESAGSDKGNYYGLTPKEIKNICKDLGMTLRSGHIHIDDKWKQTVDEAVESGQEYLICSSMPAEGQTVDNYMKAAERFNKAGEECAKQGIKFGYHNHDAEFETADGKVLYDILLDNTQPELVHMEMDLGWVVAAGKNPVDYFERYPHRFELWHLKDMNVAKKHSVEFGKGSLNILAMFKNINQSGMKYFFVEQENYASTPFESMQYNMDYLKNLRY